MKKKNIRILVLPSWYLPDGGGIFKDHAEALHSGRYKVDVMVNRVLRLTRNSLHQIVKSVPFREKIEGPLKVFRTGTLMWPGFEKKNLSRWVNRYLDFYREYEEKYGKPDIIIVHSTVWAGYVAALLKEKKNIPYILIEHRSRFARDVQSAQKMIREWYFPYIRRTLVLANQIVTVSPSIDNQLISISPGIRNKVMTIPNLVDTGFFVLPEKKRSREPFIITSFGKLEPAKGFDILIRAFAKFVNRHNGEFFLRIGGGGTKYHRLKKLARKLGVENRVSIHKYVPRTEVLREMQLASLFVLPSRFEASGAVLIEAMATGSPVISTHSGGPSYIVKEGFGLLVQPDNEVSLTDALEKIYADYERFQPDEIRNYVKESFSKETIRGKYHNLILEILNEKSISSK